MILADSIHLAATKQFYNLQGGTTYLPTALIADQPFVLIPMTGVPDVSDRTLQYFLGLSKNIFYDISIDRKTQKIKRFQQTWIDPIIFKTNQDVDAIFIRDTLLKETYLSKFDNVKDIYEYSLTQAYTPFDVLYEIKELKAIAEKVTKDNASIIF